MEHKFSNPQNAREFILGGNATFTAVSETTGKRFTFKVTVAENSNNSRFFVKMLTGSDNTSSYSYIGMIVYKQQRLPVVGLNAYVAGPEAWTFVTTKASRITEDSIVFKSLNYILKALSENSMPAKCQIWHAGKCGRCGRKLTVPSSLESGIGPECAKQLGIAGKLDLPNFKINPMPARTQIEKWNND